MQIFVAFLATLACAFASPYAPYQYGLAYASAYSYGPSHITVLPNGHLADTPEVAQAKGAHHLAQAYVAAAASANPDYGSYPYAHGYSYATPNAYVAHGASYTGPYSHVASYGYAPAHITVLPNGYLADTPEVAFAKGAHHVAKSYVRVAASSYYHGYPYSFPAYYGAHY